VADAAECLAGLAVLAGVSLAGDTAYDWDEIEDDLGTRLPADYKLLAQAFPGGWFRQFVRPAKPARQYGDGPWLLGEWAAGKIEGLRQWRAQGDGTVPYPVYPEPGGLLLWGGLRDGGYACWLTSPREPEGWPVVIASSHCGGHWERFDGTVCEFLTEVAAARYDASGFTAGPISGVVYASGERVETGPPVILASRPVFEHDSKPPEVPSAPDVPPADFWLTRFSRPGDLRPLNEMGALRELIGAPPAAVPTVDWAAVHGRLGFRLPSDYREFIDAYGPGTFGDIRITAPGAPGEMDLFALLKRKYQQVQRMAFRMAFTAPPVYPEPGGTIFWGETTGGWSCGWAPTGPDPDEWNVAAFMPGLRGFGLRAGVSFSSMLKEHARLEPGAGELLPPSDPAAGLVTFTPYQQA
jgi:hypothetical protein